VCVCVRNLLTGRCLLLPGSGWEGEVFAEFPVTILCHLLVESLLLEFGSV
jgi:hypothetical protein